jgi:head-tail adaptor
MATKEGAAKYDRLITLQRHPNANTATPDSFGETSGVPTTDTSLRNIKAAKVDPSDGSEFLEALKRQAVTRQGFLIRYRAGINVRTIVETHQILYVEGHKANPEVTRTFDIKAAHVGARRLEIFFEVEEVR